MQKNNQAKDKLLRAEALKEDLDILKTTLEEAHPGLYWYSNKDAIDKQFDSVQGMITQDLHMIDFFKLLLPVVANVRCSHTSLRLPTNTKEAAIGFTNILPFDFFCTDKKVYVRRGFQTNKYDGAEIHFINDVGTERVLETILQSFPSDGYNKTFKYSRLSKGAFREGFALYFGQTDSFTIKATDNRTGQRFSFNVKAVSPRQIAPDSTYLQQPFLLTFQQNSAILAINTFELTPSEFRDSISTLFALIRKKSAKNLIIDLRQNGGGFNNNVSILYAYLAKAPFRHLKTAEISSFPLTYTKLITNWKSVQKLYNNRGNNLVHNVKDLYAGLQIENPATQDVFRGEVILLVSGNTASAASEFVAIAHYLQRAKIVGEETGGCYYGGTGGNYVNLELPHSKLVVRIPTIKIRTAVKEDYGEQPKGRGTLPDYTVLPTVADIINRKDVQLETALEMLEPRPSSHSFVRSKAYSGSTSVSRLF